MRCIPQNIQQIRIFTGKMFTQEILLQVNSSLYNARRNVVYSVRLAIIETNLKFADNVVDQTRLMEVNICRGVDFVTFV